MVILKVNKEHEAEAFDIFRRYGEFSGLGENKYVICKGIEFLGDLFKKLDSANISYEVL